MTLAEIDDRLSALKALPAGVLSVSFAGRTTTFASIDGIAEEIGRLEILREQAAGATDARPRTWLAYPNPGA